MRRWLVLVLSALAALMSAPVFAHGPYGPRVHFGFGFGGPVFYPAPYYYPPYPPAIVYAPAVPPTPQTYIERDDATADRGQGYWYWCAEAKAYYPYVKQCPGGWQAVTPGPPAG